MEQLWIWLIVGLVLCAAELLTGTFVILFFGLGALITAAAAFLGVQSLAMQVVIFALMSLVLLFIFRKKLLRATTAEEKAKSLSPDIGAHLTLSDAIPAHGETLVAYQGTHWTAVNGSATELPKGSNVVIDRTEGIKIFVRKVN